MVLQPEKETTPPSSDPEQPEMFAPFGAEIGLSVSVRYDKSLQTYWPPEPSIATCG